MRAALADACIGPAATADEKPLKKIKPENKNGKGNEKEEEKKEREMGVSPLERIIQSIDPVCGTQSIK